MAEIRIDAPDDSFTRGKSYGVDRAELRLIAPDSMTADRLRAIAKAKDGRVACVCQSISPIFGPVLEAQWMEDGIKVLLTGVIDVEAGRRELEQRKGLGLVV